MITNFIAMTLRAMALRCPNCGGPFLRGLRLLPSCPQCHMKLDRGEEGYFLGSMAFNIVGCEVLVLGLMVWTVMRRLPASPTIGMYVGCVSAAIVLPLVFFPWSKTLWLAFDLTFRPPRPNDFAA